MKIVVAPDSFKGSLSAKQVADSIGRGILSANAHCTVVKFPIADGGEGTVEALVEATKGRIIKKIVKDPLMRDIEGFYGILGDDRTAVIELAAASGLTLLTEEERNPMLTTTYGTGQLIADALDSGYKKIIIGIGGSATNDGGAGILQALGVKFLDKYDNLIGPGGGELDKIVRFDTNGLNKKIEGIEIIVACDVDNVLCGENGAANVFARQKGADDEMVKILDTHLLHFGNIIKRELNKDIINFKGAGAAGGTGGGLKAFLNATLLSGIDIVLQYAGLENEIKDADWVITGEGRIDSQTLHGKAPYGVAKAAQKYGVPVIGIAGTLGEELDQLYENGFTYIFPIMTGLMTLEYAMENCSILLEDVSKSVIQKIK